MTATLESPVDLWTIGQKIRTLRDAAGKTRNELAASLGVDPSTIYRLENGTKVRFHIDFPKRLANELGCDVADIWADCEPEGDD